MQSSLSRRELFRKGPFAILGLAFGSTLFKDDDRIRSDANGHIQVQEGEKVIVQVAGEHVQVNQCNVEGGVVAGTEAQVLSSYFRMGDHATGVKVEQREPPRGGTSVIASQFNATDGPDARDNCDACYSSSSLVAKQQWHPYQSTLFLDAPPDGELSS